MKLIDSQVTRVEIPLTTPFRTALREVHAVEEIRVRLCTDTGLEGLGAASPTAAVTGDTAGSIADALSDYLLPRLSQVEELAERSTVQRVVNQALVGNPSAKAAVDIALHDLYAKSCRQSLLEWLGGHEPADALFTDATVSLGDVESMAQQAQSLCHSGFTTLKVKLGGRDGRDLERMSAVREAVGSAIILRVDANQGWTVRETIGYIPGLHALAVELVEQPVAARDLEGMRQISQISPIPIAADESVYGLDDLLRIIQTRSCDVVNFKLMKTGGLANAATMIAVARHQGFQVMIGSMMEGIASLTAAVALATAFDVEYLDLDAGYFLKEPKTHGGISYRGPEITPSSGPGLGVAW